MTMTCFGFGLNIHTANVTNRRLSGRSRWRNVFPCHKR